MNPVAVARGWSGSVDQVTRIVRLAISVTTSGDVRDQPAVASAALPDKSFEKEKCPCSLVYGVASLPARRTRRAPGHLRGRVMARRVTRV
jgi:hypothetical protein